MTRLEKQREAEREEIQSNPDLDRYQETSWSNSEDEGEQGRPKRYTQVQFENKWKEKFEGKVMGVQRKNDRKIWVKVNGDEEQVNIDLENIKRWRYKPGENQKKKCKML